MSRAKETSDASDLDRLIVKITSGAIGDDDRYSAFRAAFQAGTELPCGGIVIGEPVSVIAWDYDGNERRGVTARCRREGGSEYVVAAWEVAFPEAAGGAEFLAAYRRWMGLEPYRDPARPSTVMRGSGEGESGEIEIGKPIDMVIVAVKDRAAQCRLQGRDRSITLRTSEIEALVPGEIARVHPKKLWTYARHEYLSGEIAETRLDVKVLGLVPLKLKEEGMWDPEEIEEDPDDQQIGADRPRPKFEMEQVLPGSKPEDDTDPIIDANELKDMGDYAGARQDPSWSSAGRISDASTPTRTSGTSFLRIGRKMRSGTTKSA